MAIWQRAGVVPYGHWYVVTKDFMLATLRKANDRKAYYMTDSSTWVSAHAELGNLELLFRGDPMLVNVYHALCQPEGAAEGRPLASKFVDLLSSDEAQAIVRNYGKERYGKSIYCDAWFADNFAH
jgi:tungstate transport system substrate-binding protein